MANPSDRRHIAHVIEMPGLASEPIGAVTLDEKYALILVRGTYGLAIVRLERPDPPTFREVVFYANCLAYEHDLPTLTWPVKGRTKRALIQPIEGGRRGGFGDSYYQSLAVAYEELRSVKLGPLGYVCFRWPGFARPVDLRYSEKYGSAAKELSLYSTAVRQFDPLSEFLHYYRIIESVSGTNGKAWISQNLGRIRSQNFGFLEFGSDAVKPPPKRRTNVFTVYTRRALKRLASLNARFPAKDIADYFYHENRCAIAHGTSNVKTYDFEYNVEEISWDVYVLKLLSRIGIEDMC
jgi:hypothetical protein